METYKWCNLCGSLYYRGKYCYKFILANGPIKFYVIDYMPGCDMICPILLSIRIEKYIKSKIFCPNHQKITDINIMHICVDCLRYYYRFIYYVFDFQMRSIGIFLLNNSKYSPYLKIKNPNLFRPNIKIINKWCDINILTDGID
jgi:hypothetical protein